MPKKAPLKLFFYQKEAVKKWDENHRRLLLQMATGTGKTRTAIGCMEKALNDTAKLVVIIACPHKSDTQFVYANLKSRYNKTKYWEYTSDIFIKHDYIVHIRLY